MSVERYITEIPLTFDVSDECSVHWRVKYETYAASDADAETTSRRFVLDMRKKLGQSMSDYVCCEMYNWKSTPTIDERIKVIRTHYHHDFLDSHDELPLMYTDEDCCVKSKSVKIV